MPVRGEMLPERTERAEKRVSALVRNSLGVLLVGGGVAVLTIFVATGIDGSAGPAGTRTWIALGRVLQGGIPIMVGSRLVRF